MARSRSLRMLAPLATLALILTACPAGGSSPAGGASGGASGGATGGSITVTSLWGGAEAEAFQTVLDAFKAKTGITVTYSAAARPTTRRCSARRSRAAPRPTWRSFPASASCAASRRPVTSRSSPTSGSTARRSRRTTRPGILDVGHCRRRPVRDHGEVQQQEHVLVPARRVRGGNAITVPKTWDDFKAADRQAQGRPARRRWRSAPRTRGR